MRRSRVRFQIFLWCLKAKFQIPLSAEACLRLTPRHLSICFGREVDGVKMSWRRFLYLCICIFMPCICSNADTTRSEWGIAIKIVIIVSNFSNGSGYAAQLAAIWAKDGGKTKGQTKKQRWRHKCTKTMTKYSSNRVLEKSMVFESNTFPSHRKIDHCSGLDTILDQLTLVLAGTQILEF